MDSRSRPAEKFILGLSVPVFHAKILDMKFILQANVLVGLGLMAALDAGARTITVDLSGGGDAVTVQAGAELAQSGDVVLVKPGVYREEVRVPRGGYGPEGRIVFRSERPHAAVLKGSDVWKRTWTPLADSPGCVASPIDAAVFKGGRNPYLTTISIGSKDTSFAARPLTNAVVNARTYAPRTLGQIFLDGEELTEVTDLETLRRSAGTWMVSHDGQSVWMHPTASSARLEERLVEWSVRNRVFGAARRGLAHVVLDGFAVEHCANQGPFPQIGMVDVRTGVGWVIENNVIRHAKTVGVMIGAETWDGKQIPDVPEADQRLMHGGVHVVRHNVVSDCGLAGISGWDPNVSFIVNNVVERNNRGAYGWPNAYWEEAAGIKFHGFHGTIANNVVRDNDARGIWLDTTFDNARITGNVILRNRHAGIMFESCFGHALVDNNVIGLSTSWSSFYNGDGVYSHNGSLVTVAHNLLFRNAGAGVRFRTTWGKIGKRDYETSGNRYLNNVFIGNAGGDLCVAATNNLSSGTVSDGNVYIGEGYPSDMPPLPFRFANYHIGTETWTNLHARQCAVSTNAIGYTMWRALGQPVTLEDWRRLQGTDANSLAVRGGTADLAAYDLFLTLKLPKAVCEKRVPAPNFADRDFFGNRYPAPGTPVLPGPFQDASLVVTNGTQFAIHPFERGSTLPPVRDWERDDAPPSKAFRHGETVVFLGDSITHQARWTGFISRHYLENFPTNRYRFVNAGVGGDTAGGCLCRLDEDVTSKRPDVIVVMFGMNDLGWGIWEREFGEKARARADQMMSGYEQNMRRLGERLTRDNPQARIVWCTPSIYDDTSTFNDNFCFNRNRLVLARAAEFVKRLGAERGEQVIDFNGPMSAYNQTRQKTEPAYTLVGPDRVHPGDAGAFFMACTFLKQQGLDPRAADFTVPWPATGLSPLFAKRQALEGKLRELAAVRWYLRRQKEISNIDDMKQVQAFADKLKASGARGYFEDRVPGYLTNWNWPQRAIILEQLRLADVEVEKWRRRP